MTDKEDTVLALPFITGGISVLVCTSVIRCNTSIINVSGYMHNKAFEGTIGFSFKVRISA